MALRFLLGVTSTVVPVLVILSSFSLSLRLDVFPGLAANATSAAAALAAFLAAVATAGVVVVVVVVVAVPTVVEGAKMAAASSDVSSYNQRVSAIK